MRPPQNVIDELAPVLMGNAENAVADFEARLGGATQQVPEHICGMLFCAYVAGMTSVMDPKSKWNAEFRFAVEAAP